MNPLHAFWTRFASERHDVAGALLLEQPGLPFLEVNAGYPESASQVRAMANWYADHGRPAIVVIPEVPGLELAVSNAGFRPEVRLVEQAHLAQGKLGLDQQPEPTEPIWIEQVPWSMARPLAEGWAHAEGQPGWAVHVAQALGRALEAHRDITAYLAVKGAQPVGMALLADGFVGWCSGKPPVKQALLERCRFDLGGPVRCVLPSDEVALGPATGVLEHHTIWVHP